MIFPIFCSPHTPPYFILLILLFPLLPSYHLCSITFPLKSPIPWPLTSFLPPASIPIKYSYVNIQIQCVYKRKLASLPSWVWMTPHRMIISSFIYSSVNIKFSFSPAKQYYIVYMHCIFFIHSSIFEHVGYFHFVSIVTEAALNMGEQISLYYNIQASLWDRPRGGIDGYCDWWISIFLRNLCTDKVLLCILWQLQSQYVT